MRHARPKAHSIELVGSCTQADFDVRQAFSIGELREGHGKELIPTREAINLIVASVAVDTAAKLFGMNPVGQLRKNQFSSGHNASLASCLLVKMTKPSRNRSHRFSCTAHLFIVTYNCKQAP